MNETATAVRSEEGASAESGEAPPAHVRQRVIHDLLEQHGFVRVRDLADRFGVSTVTVRTDLHQLEQLQMARRVHGGAMPVGGTRVERPFEEAAAEQTNQKALMARAAAALVSSGQSILLDVGTSAAALAEALVTRDELEDVTIFTNGLKIALALEAAHPRFTIVVTGGTLRPKQHSLVDPLADAMLAAIRVDTVFLGCNGVDLEAGITNVNLPEAAVKRSMLSAAARCVVLADSTKLGTQTLAKVCDLDQVDVLVTDAEASPTLIDDIRSRGVDVITS